MKLVLLVIAMLALEATAIAQPNAEGLYAEGQAAYDRADYATAIVKWQGSYDLSKEAGLLFNLAQAKRLAGDCASAIVTYRQFDATDADVASDQHKLAKDFLRELEGTCPAQKPAVISSRIITGLVTGGVGVVTLAIGLGLGHHGASIGDEITTACATSCDWGALKDREARGKREVAIGKALDVVGVAAIAGGAVFYYLGKRQESLVVGPAPSGTGGVVSWRGAW
jgi:hypothetical protein